MENSDEQESSIPEHLLAPHFDDEATLASARPVVLIATAKASETSRTIRRALPFILVAGLIGILTGGGIGYFEQRRLAGVRIELQSTPKTTEQQSEGKQEQTASQPQSAEPDAQANVSETSRDNQTPVSQANNVARTADSANPRQIQHARHLTVRIIKSARRNKERVNTTRGAGRIQEIFAGSEP